MRICIVKATGRLIEMQSDATKGTLIRNALSAGYLESEVEEREVTPAEFSDPSAPWNQPTPEEVKARRILEINQVLSEIDKKKARPIGAIVSAQLQGEDIDPADASMLSLYEMQLETLREELRGLI